MAGSAGFSCVIVVLATALGPARASHPPAAPPSSLSSDPGRPHATDGTLIDALLDPARLAALASSDPSPCAYNPDSFALVARLRGRNTRVIAVPMLTLGSLSAVCAAMLHPRFAAAAAEASGAAGVAGLPTAAAMAGRMDNAAVGVGASEPLRAAVLALESLTSPLLAPLSFLLVFRLSRAAVRFWDAREACGRIVRLSRCFVSELVVATVHAPAERAEAVRWVAAFPVAVKHALRPTTDAAARAAELAPLLLPSESTFTLSARRPPLVTIDRARAAVRDAFAGSRRGRPGLPAALAPEVCAVSFRRLNDGLNGLLEAFGTLERVASTPLPFVYVAHLRTFLLLYLGLAHAHLAAKCGWPAVPVLLALSWALLGIEAAAVECERPFRRRPNHLLLGHFCQVVAQDAAQILAGTVK